MKRGWNELREPLRLCFEVKSWTLGASPRHFSRRSDVPTPTAATFPDSAPSSHHKTEARESRKPAPSPQGLPFRQRRRGGVFGQVARGLHGSPFPTSGPDAAALVGCLSEGPSTGPPAQLSSYPTDPWRQAPTCPPCPGAANCLGCHGPQVSLAHWFPFGSYWLTARGFPTVPAETRGRSASSRQRSSLGVLKTPPEKQST